MRDVKAFLERRGEPGKPGRAARRVPPGPGDRGCSPGGRGYGDGLMGTFEIVVGAVLLAVVSFQVWLTVRVHRSKLYEPKQKVWQTQLIWLLPIVGAGLVFSILQEDERAQRPSSEIKS